MRRLLEGDITRILHKKIFYTAFIIAIAAGIAAITACFFSYQQTGYTFMYAAISCSSLTAGLMGLIIFMGIYVDEFRNMALSNAIGRGVSRNRIIIAKLLDCVILLLVSTIIYTVFLLICGKVTGTTMSPTESQAFWLYAFTGFYDIIGAICIAALFIFISGNISLGIFIYIGVNLIVPVALFLIDMVPALERFHLTRYSFSGLNEMAVAEILMGAHLRGAVTLLVSGLIYIGGSTVLMLIIFRKKELEF